MIRRLFLIACLPLLVSSADPIPPAPPRRAPLVALLGETPAARRREVAERFAPTLYQETLDPYRDLVSAFDFDGDWDGANNAAHVASFPLRAVVYYSVQETSTHWFVRYLPYHAVDYKRVGGHPHDTESILLVVRKLGEAAQLELMETRFHRVWYQYAALGSRVADQIDDLDGAIHFDDDGRPMVHAQRAGHGLCGGLAPISWLREAELVCDHTQAPRIEDRGVIYRHAGVAELPSATASMQTRGYALEELSTSLWAHARDPRTCSTTNGLDEDGVALPARIRELGYRFATAIAGSASAEPPWAQTPGQGSRTLGDHFFDPAGTLARRLRFPAPFARDYMWNPYLAIGDRSDG